MARGGFASVEVRAAAFCRRVLPGRISHLGELCRVLPSCPGMRAKTVRHTSGISKPECAILICGECASLIVVVVVSGCGKCASLMIK